jgi:hypothetical protein
MGSMPLALSVHNFITSVGADAGFASIIGLAVLVLLYFAHAKDTANLQQEAEELAHRLLQAETRLAQLSRQSAPSAAPAPAPRAARAAAGSPIRAARTGANAAAAPAAPAGVAAPALAAATRVVPVASLPASHSSEDELARPVPPEPAVAPETEDPVFAEGAEELAPPPGARAATAAASVSQRSASPVAPTPATAAGAANGGGREPRGAAAVGPRPRPAAPARERVQIRPGAPSPPRRPSAPPRGPAPGRGGSRRRVGLLIGALVAVAAVVALVVATQTGSGTPSRSASSSTTNAPGSAQHHAAAPFKPSSVTVAVLNGTATNELAHRVAAKLSAVGYKQGTVATASNQTVTSTAVSYLPGSRNAALHVAAALKLGPASVQPIDSNTRPVACPPPSACTANVVVTVGQDLATL